MGKELVIPRPKKIKWSEVKFRASGFGMLVSGFFAGITDKQLKRLNELETKKFFVKPLGKGDSVKLEKLESKKALTPEEVVLMRSLQIKASTPKGLTDNQGKELDDLIKLKSKEPELGKGAKTSLRKMFKEIKYNRRKPLDNKYLTKGITQEEEAISFLSRHHGQWFENNKERRYSEYFQGECDIIESYDTKCSFELSTMPDKKAPLDIVYETQNRIYMILWPSKEWTTSYILLNMSDDMMVDTMYREAFRWKDNEIPEWKKLEILNLYIYDEKNFYRLCKIYECIPNEESEEKAIDIFTGFVEIPDSARIVEKKVVHDPVIEKNLEEIARLSRIYLQELEDEGY